MKRYAIRNKAEDSRLFLDLDTGRYVLLEPGEEYFAFNKPKFESDYFELEEIKKRKRRSKKNIENPDEEKEEEVKEKK